MPAGSPGPVWFRVSPGSPGQAVSCRRFENKAKAMAQTKVTALEQVLPSPLAPSQSVGLSKPLAFASPCPRGGSSPATLMVMTSSGKSSPEAQGFLRKERASAVDDDPWESHVQPRRLRPAWGQGGKHHTPGREARAPKGAGVTFLQLPPSRAGQEPGWHIHVCLSLPGLCPAVWAPTALSPWLRGSRRLGPQGVHASDGVRMLSAFMVMFGFLIALPNRRMNREPSQGLGVLHSFPASGCAPASPSPLLVPAQPLPCPGHPGGLLAAGPGVQGLQRSEVVAP